MIQNSCTGGIWNKNQINDITCKVFVLNSLPSWIAPDHGVVERYIVVNSITKNHQCSQLTMRIDPLQPEKPEIFNFLVIIRALILN